MAAVKVRSAAQNRCNPAWLRDQVADLSKYISGQLIATGFVVRAHNAICEGRSWREEMTS